MNVFKTYILLVALTAILMAFGYLLDRVLGTGGMMLWIFFGLAIVGNWVSYFYSDKIVLAMYHAKAVTPSEAPELHEIVDRLCARAGIPKPGVYIIPTDAPNAFATGRNPSHAAVACTEGILRALNRDQIEGVLAHELAHVRNRDTLVSTVAATLAGAIGMAAHSAQWGMMWGGGHRDSREGGSNPLVAILLLVFAILAPIIAMLVQMAISRQREYGADAAGALFCGNPEGLASALERLEAFSARYEMPATEGTSHLFIVNPLSGSKAMALFSTHPPTEERVRRLRAMSRDLAMGRGAVATGLAGTVR
jgi:heat shock protein HtpX